MSFEPTQKREVPAHEREIPESEFRFAFSLSGGPGGQNVNKKNSKAELYWDVERSAVFSAEEKAIIRDTLANRINARGELYVTNTTERSPLQNKRKAAENLRALVREAMTPERERIETKPTAGSKERRIQDKKREGAKKATRRWQPE